MYQTTPKIIPNVPKDLLYWNNTNAKRPIPQLSKQGISLALIHLAQCQMPKLMAEMMSAQSLKHHFRKVLFLIQMLHQPCLRSSQPVIKKYLNDKATKKQIQMTQFNPTKHINDISIGTCFFATTTCLDLILTLTSLFP